MNVVRFFYLLCFCSVLFCCKSTSRKQSSGEQTVKGKVDTVSRIHIKYAKGFWLEEREGYVVLNIKDPQESSHTHYQYALVPRGSTVQTPKDLPGGGVARAECHLHDLVAALQFHQVGGDGSGGGNHEYSFPV